MGAAGELAAVDVVDEHLDLTTDERIARGAGDRLLHRFALAQPFQHDLLVDRVGEARRGRSIFRREGEEAGPVERRRLEEREQFIVLAFTFTREAHDERGPECGIRLVGADVVDQGEEPVAAPPTLHPAQQPRVGVLQREVEVGHDGRKFEHRGDERVAHFARIEIQQSHPRQTVGREAVEATQQRRERTGCTDVASIPGEVLCDQHQFGDPGADQRARFGLDRLGAARTLLAPERRDGTERTGAVAALGDLHVGPRHRRRRPSQLEQVPHARRLPLGQAERHRRAERSLAREPDDRVDLGQRRRQLVAVALRHAAGHHQLGAALARHRRGPARCRSTPGGRPR